MFKYVIRDVFCHWGIYEICGENERLLLILNSCTNAQNIVKILNADECHNVVNI